jgi:hypothetical protein
LTSSKPCLKQHDARGRRPDNWRHCAAQEVERTLLSYPVVVGQGTRPFPDTGPDTALDLVESRSTPSGITIQIYRPTGRPQYETATA